MYCNGKNIRVSAASCVFYTHIRQMVRKSIYLTFMDVLQAMSISMLITMDSRKGFCLVSPPCHYLFIIFLFGFNYFYPMGGES